MAFSKDCSPPPSKRSRRGPPPPPPSKSEREEDNNDDDNDDPFKSLPDEILIRILSFLDTSDLATRASLVCRRFARISSDPALWKLVDVDGMRLDRRNAQRLIDRCTKMEELALRNRSDDGNLARRALDNCSHLKTLHIYSCEETDSSKRQTSLIKTIGRGESLKNLRWVGLDPNVLRSNAGCLEHLECLQFSIDGANDDNEFGIDIEALGAVAGVCNKLNSCYIAGEDGDSDDEDVVADKELNRFLEGVKDTMEDMDIDCQKSFTKASLKNVVKCGKLKRLSLDSPKMEGGTLRSMVELLPRLKSLEITFYRQNGLNDLLKPENFADAFRGRQTILESLMLTHCDGMNDKSLAVIAEACPRLTFLGLAYCKNVTDSGIGIVLEKCADLAKIDVRGLDSLTREPFKDAVERGRCGKLREMFCEYYHKEMRSLEEIIPELKADLHYPHSSCCGWQFMLTF